MPEPRRRFDRDFKREAVKLATRGDKTLTPVAGATWVSARMSYHAGSDN